MNPTTAPRVMATSMPKLGPLLEYLGGLSGPADLDGVRGTLEKMAITRADLVPVCVFRCERYQRNLIGKSPWYELVCLCWSSGQRTPIHDHAGSSCAFLVVEGIATETRFVRTPSGLVCSEWTKHHEPGYVCASHEADIHQVANVQPPGNDLVTLHLYSPQLVGYNIYHLDTPTAGDPVPAKA